MSLFNSHFLLLISLSTHLKIIPFLTSNSQTKTLILFCETGRFRSVSDSCVSILKMSSITEIPDADFFPSFSMPVTVVLTGVLLFVIFAGFISLFFWRFFLNRLFSAWNLQRTPYGDLNLVSTPPENTGLDPFIIRSFPVFRYSSAIKKNHGTECAICLSEFSDGDTVRLIPVCRHAFHSNCIDLWFELHKTCPVCRCELDPGLVGSGSQETLHNTVTITIQDLSHDEEIPPTTSSSKRLTEPSTWRFSRSHSTGHFMVKTTDLNLSISRRHYQTGSCVTFDELTRYDEATGWLRESSSYITRIEV